MLLSKAESSRCNTSLTSSSRVRMRPGALRSFATKPYSTAVSSTVSPARRSLHSLLSVVHAVDSVAFRFEILCYQLAEFSVVVDDQILLHRQIVSSEFNVYVAVPVSVPLAVLTRRQQAEV